MLRIQALRSAVLHRFRPGNAQERPDESHPPAAERARGHALHTAEAGQPGTTYDVHEDGLGLVVRGVTERHGAGAGLLRDPCEEPVPDLAGSLLDRQAVLLLEPFDVDTVGRAVDAQAAKDIRDEPGVRLRRVASEGVVEMRAVEIQVQIEAQVVKCVEQRERIGTPRYGDDEALAVAQARFSKDFPHLAVDLRDDPRQPHHVSPVAGSTAVCSWSA